jgi:hypothetical protein
VTTDPAGKARNATACWLQNCGSDPDDELHAMIKGSAMTCVPLSRFRRIWQRSSGAKRRNASLIAVLDRPGRGVKNAARSTLTPAVEDAVNWAKDRLS